MSTILSPSSPNHHLDRDMRFPAAATNGLKAAAAASARGVHSAATSKVPLLLSPKDYMGLKGKVVPLDVSWHMPTSPRNADDEFNNGPRIVGARRWDLDKIAETRPDKNPLGLTHMMPTPDVFRAATQKLGITFDTHVVVYDTLGVFSAPRGAFTFKLFGHDKVSVLDGGLPRWIEAGGAVEEGPADPVRAAEGLPVESPQTGLVKSYEEMVANASLPPKSASVVLDARALGRYTGETPEPRPGLPSGHIPHSLPLPFTDLLEPATEERPYTQFKSPAELRRILVDAVGGEDVWAEVNGDAAEVGRRLTFSCGSGMTAAVLWYAQQIVAEAEGRPAPKAFIYDESWTGYAQRKESPIETGEPSKQAK